MSTEPTQPDPTSPFGSSASDPTMPIPPSYDPTSSSPPTSPWGSDPKPPTYGQNEPGQSGYAQPGWPTQPQQSPYDQQGYAAPAQPQPSPYGQPAYGQSPYPTAYPPAPPAAYGQAFSAEHPQGTTILVLGILSLVVCGILGPVAWVMGNKAIKEIDAAGGTATNRSQVNAGRICGIISTVLMVLVIAFYGVMIVVAATSASTGRY